MKKLYTYCRFTKVKLKKVYKATQPIREAGYEILVSLGENIEIALENLGDYLITKSDKLEAGFGKPSKLIRKQYKGFVVDGKKSLSLSQSENNMMIVSPSGGGKSTTIIFPTLIKLSDQSAIVNDNSGELSQVAEYKRSQGFIVKYLDFGNPHKSVYYNPLIRIKSSSDVSKISKMLVNTSNSKSDFWTLKSEELITLIISFLVFHSSKIHRNLANVHLMLEHLQSEPETIANLFQMHGSDKLNLKLAGILKNSENTRASIISSALASLGFIGNDEDLQDLTSMDTLDFEQFRREKTILFLRCPLGDSEYYKTILSIFFEQFFSTAFNKALPTKSDLHISLIIDELGSLYLPNLASIISNSRKFKLPILSAIQSENQIFENYGNFNAKTVLNNCGVKIYFTGLTSESKDLESVLGQYEYENEKGQTRTRSLMTADEIRTMPKNKILVIPSGMRPLFIHTTPYYKQPKMLKALNLEKEKGVEGSLEEPIRFKAILINLSAYRKTEELPEESDVNTVNIKIPKYGK